MASRGTQRNGYRSARRGIIIGLLACSALTGTAHAQTWVGTVDDDYANPLNWDQGQLPQSSGNTEVRTNINAPVVGAGDDVDAGNLRIGQSSTGMLTVRDGGRLTVGVLLGVGGHPLGGSSAGNGTLLVTGAGSLLSLPTNLFFVAPNNETRGVVTVEAGGTVRSLGADIGGGVGSRANVTVTGAGSLFDLGASGFLKLGSVNQPDAVSLNILDGGRVTSTSAARHSIRQNALLRVGGAGSILSLASGIDVEGNLLIEENASVTTGTAFTFGNAADSSLTLRTGGQLNTTGAQPITFNERSRVLITGAGTSWTAGGRIVIDANPAAANPVFDFRIDAGAAVTASSVLVGPDGLGAINLVGGAQLTIGSLGIGGGQVDGVAGNGTMTMTGAGTLVTSANQLFVAPEPNSRGELNVLGNAILRSQGALLGTAAGSVANVTVTNASMEIGTGILSMGNTNGAAGTFNARLNLNGGQLIGGASTTHNIGTGAAVFIDGGELRATTALALRGNVELVSGGALNYQTIDLFGDARINLVASQMNARALGQANGLSITGNSRINGVDSTITVESQLYVGDDSILTLANTSFRAAGARLLGRGTINIGAADGAAPGTPRQFSVPGISLEGADTRLVINHNGRLGLDTALGGNGAILHRSGLTTMAGMDPTGFSGLFDVTGGALYVNGITSTGEIRVSGGAMLGGNGTVRNGMVSILDGTLAPGGENGIGTLHLGALSLSSQSTLLYQLGVPNGETGGGVGSDLIRINTPDGSGNLVLDGTLNIIDAGGFGVGIYRLIDYKGSLTNNGLDVGTVPASFATSGMTVQTSVTGQVNLLVAAAAGTGTFWDGGGAANDSIVAGGSGVWTRTGTNWTIANGSQNSAYDPVGPLIFAGAGGTVTVDDSAGAVTVRGPIQFASDGYVMTGAALNYGGTEATIRVGDGSSAGAGITAAIAAEILGATRLIKTDLGTLAITDDNSIAGALEVKAGTLRIENGAVVTSNGIGVATARDAIASRLVVTGAGSVLDIGTGGFASSAFDQSTTIDILDGGTLRDSFSGSSRFGVNSAVRVSGANSLLDLATNSLFQGDVAVENGGVVQMATVEFADTASFTLRNGGRVEAGDSTGSWRFGQGADVLISGADTSFAINGTFDIMSSLGGQPVASAVIEDGAIVRATTTTDSQISFGVARTLNVRSGASLIFDGGPNAGLLLNGGSLVVENASVSMDGGVGLGSAHNSNTLTLIASDFRARYVTTSTNGNNLVNLGGTATGPAGAIGQFDVDTIGLAVASNTLVLNHTNRNFTLASDIGGSGVIRHLAGDTRFIGANRGFSGVTELSGGHLRIDGEHGDSISMIVVSGGATLSGSGRIGGNVKVGVGTLAAGGAPRRETRSVAPVDDTVGLLTIDGNLALTADSFLLYQLGALDGTSGIDSDLINVGGDLTLDGIVDIVDAGGFSAGLYRLINYGGGLTDNGLDIGMTPTGFVPGDFAIQTTSSAVNLIVGAPATFAFWDGTDAGANGGVAGGAGTWTAVASNWTIADGALNGAYDPDALLIFAGAPGGVTVDNDSGPVAVGAGVQFAVDGYALGGGPLRIDGAETVFRVGDGTDAGAAYVATIGSAITGAGGLLKSDRGTLVLTGTNSYSGETRVAGGTLRGAAANLAGPIAVENAGTLQFEQVADGTFAGALSGDGILRKTGAGILSLSGDSRAFTGGTAVEAGTLSLTGQLGGTTTVRSGAFLTGNGTVGALDVAGRVSPGSGSGIATLTVTGDVTFRAGSIYAVDLAAAGGTDLINASGVGRIEGGTVAITTLNPDNDYRDGSLYRILNAAAGLTGTFAGLTEQSAFLDFALEYDATGASLRVAQIRTFPDVALTFNQRQAASALKQLDRTAGSDSLAVYNAMLLLGEPEARAAFDASSGEIYASLVAGGQRGSMSLANRFAARGNAAIGEGVGIWGGVTGQRGRVDGDDNGGRIGRDGAGGEIGVDYRGTGNGWAAGVGGGWQSGVIDLPSRGSHADTDSWHVGGYVRYGSGGAAFTAYGSAVHISTNATVSRSITFGTLSRLTGAKADVPTVAIAGGLRYGLSQGNWAFGPTIGYEYTSSGLGRFDEKGAGALDLSAGRNRDRWSRYGMGGFVRIDSARGQFDVIARFVTGERNNASVFLDMAGSSQRFEVRAAQGSASGAHLQASGRYDLGGNWSIGGQASLLASGAERDLSGNVRLGWSF